MVQVVNATFDGRMLRPDEGLNLPPHTRVRLTVEPLADAPSPADALRKLDRLCEDQPIDSAGDRLNRDQLHERR